jgi:Domain of unknown function (DUF5076)
MRDELVIPEPAYRDPDSKEMIRAWIAEEGLHITLRIGMWSEQKLPFTEAECWGTLFADAAYHVSAALQKERGIDPKVSIAQIRARFLEEIDAPTSDHPGDFYIRKPKET